MRTRRKQHRIAALLTAVALLASGSACFIPRPGHHHHHRRTIAICTTRRHKHCRPTTTTVAPPTTTATTGGTTQPTTTTKPPTTTTTQVPQAGEIRLPGTYTTGYDFYDNNPPNSAAISHPIIHQQADGTGTFTDPITTAIDSGQFPWGTKFYIPNLRAYFIAEDTIGNSPENPPHLDLWVDGRTSTVQSAYNCMSHITGHYLVIQNPASNYIVEPGHISANNTCRTLYGDAVVTNGGPTTTTLPPVTTTTKPPVNGGACPTTDSPSTYPGPVLTNTQIMQAAYNAGFHTVSQLQAIVGIASAESSKTNATRNWHTEYGCRPASDVIGVQGPNSVWNVGHTQQLHSDRGVFQISSHFWPQYTDAICDNVATAAQAMWDISNHGTNFNPWDTYPSPALSQAPSTAEVNAFLATQ